ncbi:LacI family DNA-binding transcriptional regulator [Telmatobacter bradus]|uniref:LacI family DNA-binding transcriptional regulator n=1 Tax=Telmatobacter bradus TaxID=474953 RepID=UPI003B42F9AD
MATTMKDIARELGVSIITVSKVLRNHADIGEKTRQRVLDKVREMNYTPNLAARSLVTGRTYLVALVVPDLLHTFFAEIAKSLSAALLKKGYCLTISTTEEDPALEERTIERLLARRVDALIIASALSHSATLERVQSEGLPLVLIDRRFPMLDANYVGVDDERVGELATSHLITIGCKRIAHLRGPDTSCGRGRVDGYRKAIAAHGLKLHAASISDLSLADAHGIAQGEALTRRLLQVKTPPDGIFTFNDAMAIGAIHALQEAGLRVPEDVAVIGAGNLYYNDELRVPLSTIDQQTTQAGEHTARLVLALLEAKTPPKPRTILLEPRLVARASTRRAAAHNKKK